MHRVSRSDQLVDAVRTASVWTHCEEMPELREQVEEHGFAIARGILPRPFVDEAYRATVKVLRRFWPDAPAPLESAEPWADASFHVALAALRRSAPKMFGAFYDTMQVSLAVKAAATASPIVDMVTQLLGEDAAGLAATGHMLRMDPPTET